MNFKTQPILQTISIQNNLVAIHHLETRKWTSMMLQSSPKLFSSDWSEFNAISLPKIYLKQFPFRNTPKTTILLFIFKIFPKSPGFKVSNSILIQILIIMHLYSLCLHKSPFNYISIYKLTTYLIRIFKHPALVSNHFEISNISNHTSQKF